LRAGQAATPLVSNTIADDHAYAPYRDAHVAPEFGQINAEDGQILYYALYKPKAFDPARRYPVVFDIYGGPHAQRVRNAYLLDWKQLLLQRGFIVVTLDNRGMANRGLDFEQVIHRQLGGPEVRDQQAMVAQLKQWPFVDPARIGVFGWSYGGYMALNLLCKTGDFAAAVAVAPVTDWALYDSAYTERYMGHPQPFGDAYQRSSVLNHVDGCNGKLLLVHGMADDNVLFLHSVKLMAALQRKNKAFDLMTYPGSAHGIAGQAERIHLFTQAINFFHKHLSISAPVQPIPAG
jgi:dipeptidyl-peptidase-4